VEADLKAARWLSWGTLRRLLHPLWFRYISRSAGLTTTSVEGFELQILPSVFHPKYSGSSVIFARFISKLALNGKTLLEMGCGSGIVALCAARAGALVVAVDINPDAVECTRRNAERAGLRLDVRQSDVYDRVPERFDVIAWNPPFFPGTPKDPAGAAFYAGDHYQALDKFAAGARAHLNPGGRIYTILSSDADLEALKGLFERHALTWRVAALEKWLFGERMLIIEHIGSRA